VQIVGEVSSEVFFARPSLALGRWAELLELSVVR